MLDVIQNGNQMTSEKRRNFKSRSLMKREQLILLEENINRIYQMIFEESNGNQLTFKITFKYLNMNEAYLVIIDENGECEEIFLRLYGLKSKILDSSIPEI
jgi:hypothetical protein